MKIQELEIIGKQILRENNIEDSNLKAKLLLQHVLNISKQQILIDSYKNITKQEEEKYLKHIQELIEGKPLQYITQEQQFMGLSFGVNENVLIPQPDTEILVEEAIQYIEKDMKVLDLCTGSGAIAISIAHYTNAIVYASDISEEALEVARKNAICNKVNVEYILSNMFKNIQNNLEFDVIVSNPPYIETNVINTLAKEVREEPYIALDGGEDGLDFYRVIANQASKFLKNNGVILLEIGYNQKEEVINIFKKTNIYSDIKCIKDLSGNDRVITMRKKV